MRLPIIIIANDRDQIPAHIDLNSSDVFASFSYQYHNVHLVISASRIQTPTEYTGVLVYKNPNISTDEGCAYVRDITLYVDLNTINQRNVHFELRANNPRRLNQPSNIHRSYVSDLPSFDSSPNVRTVVNQDAHRRNIVSSNSALVNMFFATTSFHPPGPISRSRHNADFTNAGHTVQRYGADIRSAFSQRNVVLALQMCPHIQQCDHNDRHPLNSTNQDILRSSPDPVTNGTPRLENLSFSDNDSPDEARPKRSLIQLAPNPDPDVPAFNRLFGVTDTSVYDDMIAMLFDKANGFPEIKFSKEYLTEKIETLCVLSISNQIYDNPRRVRPELSSCRDTDGTPITEPLLNLVVSTHESWECQAYVNGETHQCAHLQDSCMLNYLINHENEDFSFKEMVSRLTYAYVNRYLRSDDAPYAYLSFLSKLTNAEAVKLILDKTLLIPNPKPEYIVVNTTE
jgi:hypothetical protein